MTGTSDYSCVFPLYRCNCNLRHVKFIVGNKRTRLAPFGAILCYDRSNRFLSPPQIFQNFNAGNGRVQYSDFSSRTTSTFRCGSLYSMRSNRPLSPPQIYCADHYIGLRSFVKLEIGSPDSIGKDFTISSNVYLNPLSGGTWRETSALCVSLLGLSQACGLPSLSSTPPGRNPSGVSDKSAFFRVWRITPTDRLFGILIYVRLAASKWG